MMGALDPINRWLFVGATPPPFGGVTIFAKRLVAKWLKEGKFVVVMDLLRASRLRKAQYLFRLIFAPKRHGIYINDLSGVGLIGAALNLLGSSIFFHDHNYNLDVISGLRALALKHCLARCTTVFFDGLHSRQNYIARGFLSESKAFQFSSPFLPQDLSQQASITSKYPLGLSKFISDHSPIISANAFRITLTSDGVDLYGLDMCIALLAEVRKRAPNAGFVFALSDDSPSAHLLAMQTELRVAELEEHFFFFTSTDEVWPIFQLSNVMIRPTSTDGFGISIAESLHAGTPAIASDVCERPEGTIIFRSRDQADLNSKVFQVLQLAQDP